MGHRIRDQAAYKVDIYCDSKPNDKGYERAFFTINKSFKNKSGEYEKTEFFDLQELHVMKSMIDRAILWATKLDNKSSKQKKTDIEESLPSLEQLNLDVDKAFDDDDIPF